MPLVATLCPPALLYLGFSIIQIIIDLFRSDHVTAFFKFLITIVFLFILQNLCDTGLSLISWFIVFVPFIMMTYVSSIVFYLFGMKPSPSEAGQVTKGKKEIDPNYFNKANSNPGYPTNPISGMTSENEKINVKI
jgi:hypothetical protein